MVETVDSRVRGERHWRARRRRRWAVAVLVLAVGGVVTGVLAATDGSGSSGSTTGARTAVTVGAAVSRRGGSRSGQRRLVERGVRSLPAPVQDEAAVGLGGGQVMLLGGLTAADTSRTDIWIAGLHRDRRVGSLPTGLHDTAAVRLGNSIYLFGGGTAANTQSDEIFRVPLTGSPVTVAGRLPAPSSDQSTAAIGGTAYVVGGYTGSRWLDTIVAWRPGRAARVVAHLPTGLRYAAVTVVGGRLVIAGGSLPNGSASVAVLVYRPGGGVGRIGRLPAPTTHAAAATIGATAYVIGGRGAVLDTPTARIVAVDPGAKRIR